MKNGVTMKCYFISETLACLPLTAKRDVCPIRIPRHVGQAAVHDKPSDKMCKVVICRDDELL